MPKWFTQKPDEEVLDQYQISRAEVLRRVVFLPALVTVIYYFIHSFYEELDGPRLVTFSILFFAVNLASFLYGHLRNAWVLTDKRLALRRGLTIPIVKIEGAFEKGHLVVVKTRPALRAKYLRLSTPQAAILAEEINRRRFDLSSAPKESDPT